MADEARLPGEVMPAAGQIIPDQGRETVTLADIRDRPIRTSLAAAPVREAEA